MTVDYPTTLTKARILAQALVNSVNAGEAFTSVERYAHVPDNTKSGGMFEVDFEGESFTVSVVGNVQAEPEDESSQQE